KDLARRKLAAVMDIERLDQNALVGFVRYLTEPEAMRSDGAERLNHAAKVGVLGNLPTALERRILAGLLCRFQFGECCSQCAKQRMRFNSCVSVHRSVPSACARRMAVHRLRA